MDEEQLAIYFPSYENEKTMEENAISYENY